MTKTTTITINGRVYDAITGQPVHQSAQAPHRPARSFNDIGPSRTAQPMRKQSARPDQPHAKAVHMRTQKSETLYRQALKKPAVEAAPPTRSPLISRFATEPTPPARTVHTAPVDTTPQVTAMHPIMAKVLQKQAAAAQPEPTSKHIKEQLIKERLAEVGDKPKRQNFWARQPRVATILASTLSLLILGGYLTYINLPNISMKVAATRAGVSAVFPNYRPDGYSLNGPITYSPGQVTISYKSNTNDSDYKLTQKASNWDSQAVLDNYVSKQTGNYLTFQDHGLTIYTFNNKAAWANGGMLYTIEGTASLSSDQILRLATSM